MGLPRGIYFNYKNENFMKILFVVLLFCNCLGAEKKKTKKVTIKNEIECTDEKCFGSYIGPEFINGADVAHQFSNKMSHEVGNKLKELYKNKKFSKVDFSKIIMTTKGMGTGNVEYKLMIPFITVDKKCDAYTSFDHVGGWNHKPNLLKRIKELSKALLEGERLDISSLKITNEGLQEYWIQWKNKLVQADCK